MTASPGALRIALTLVGFNAGLLALELPRHWGPGPNWLAFEALAITGLFLLLPRRRWTRWPAALAGVLAVLLTVLAGLDAVVRLSLARPLNVYLDYPLATSVYDLAAGTLGGPLAALVLTLSAAALALLGWAVAGALLALRPPHPATRRRLAGAVLLVLGLGGAINNQMAPAVPRAIVPAWTLLADQVHWALRSHRESQAFAAMLAERPPRPAGRLSGFADTDVVIGLIESYGVSAVFDDRYAVSVRPRLRDLARGLAGNGLHMVTGTLEAPTAGGQSWLSHATLLSGLWVDNQLRYRLLLREPRDTLVQDFAATGHRTAVVKPAITQAWPQGAWYRFDRVLAAEDMGYQGPALNWVTMPDQFTWWRFQEAVRGPTDAPVFGVLALISSHAPWVPILPVLDDWDSLADGRVFQRWADAGLAPEHLWQDTDRVRAHYAGSVGYALGVAGSWAREYMDDETLLVVLGDHQAAPLITGDEAGRAVPVHVISSDPERLAPLRRRGFIPGAVPAGPEPLARMDALRGWLHADYGDGASNSP
ncbi:MAG: sulfatase [Ectothiorhodospiraceae bacterium]